MKPLSMQDPMIVTMVNAAAGGVFGILFGLAILCVISGVGYVIPHTEYSATSSFINRIGDSAIPAMILGSIIGSILGGVVGLRRSK